MILYQLVCASGHEFEGWFRDGATYDRQRAGRKIECPQCGGRKIKKAPMAPRVAKSPAREQAAARAQAVAEHLDAAAAELRKQIETHCHYVGDSFAEEARRIHYGETEARGIYGEASNAEASALNDEGIEFARVPWGPRKAN